MVIEVAVPILVATTGLVGALGGDQDGPPTLSSLEATIRLSENEDRAQWWPAVEELGRIASQNAAIRDEVWDKARVNTAGMKFVEIKPGRFIQGPDLWWLFTIARPVEIPGAYFIAVTEVTNAQFRSVVPGFEGDSRWSPDPDSPAVNVSLEDADRFCKQLSERESAVYRLPTEEEWEYACRAGTTTAFCFGDDPGQLAQVGWYNYANGRASQVAMLKPNAWGIYDMHGNAVEWASFDASELTWGENAPVYLIDFLTRLTEGVTHVLRGGGWPAREPSACSCAARMPLPVLNRPPFSKDEAGVREALGFRVVRELDASDSRHER